MLRPGGSLPAHRPQALRVLLTPRAGTKVSLHTWGLLPGAPTLTGAGLGPAGEVQRVMSVPVPLGPETIIKSRSTMQVNSTPMPRYGASGAPAKRRELASLRGLPRSPLASYARRALDAAREAARPIRALRSRTRRLRIREFLSNNLFAWIPSYLRTRFGPRHAFPD